MSALLWVANLDCEDELERWPAAWTAPQERTAASGRAMEAARALHGAGDAWLGEALGADGRVTGRWLGARGRAWSPTPSALARLARAGVEAEPAPAAGVLRAVVHRRAHHALGSPLPGATWAKSEADLERAGEHALGSRGPARAWIAKRAFGSAGRGVRRFRDGFEPDALRRGDREWLVASFARGGLELAPLVEVEVELARHGHLSQDGALAVGRTCVQAVDARGAWRATRAANDGEVSRAHDDALGCEVERVARWLHSEGYFGPFGVDALVWRSGEGLELCARSEVNPRYSMGYAVGFGLAERAAL